MKKPLVGLSLMTEPAFANAALPLFEAGEVEVAEWSFDVLWNGAVPPPWIPALLEDFETERRLLGHGVSYSMFTIPQNRADDWCQQLAKECAARSYRHVSEHFGFMLAGEFHKGAPLPVPFTPELLELGQARIRKLADAAGVPVGLENLAFAFCLEDVKWQAEFLNSLLEPVDGFILLDLHNLYCQSFNFDIAPEKLLGAYPLERVRELHLSGGSWSEAAGTTVRRDTHDGPVPDALFPLLQHALTNCPNIEAVIFEHLGNALNTEESHEQFRADFQRISRTVATHG